MLNVYSFSNINNGILFKSRWVCLFPLFCMLVGVFVFWVCLNVVPLCSGSSDSNSSSSEGSRARSVQSTATHAPPAPPVLALDSDEPRRSFGIRVQNLPTRSTGDRLLLTSPVPWAVFIHLI